MTNYVDNIKKGKEKTKCLNSGVTILWFLNAYDVYVGGSSGGRDQNSARDM